MTKKFFQILLKLAASVILLRILFLLYNTTVPSHINKEDGVTVRYFFPTSTELPLEKCTENTSVQSLPTFKDESPNFKDFLTYRHCRAFPLILDAPNKCGGPNAKEVFLLLAIKSAPGHFERREAVRRTWGAEKTYGGAQVKRLFLTGIPRNDDQSKRMMQLLSTESEIYGDILQWNFEDSFYNLTLKQVLFHQWLGQKCPGVQFILNGDDDVFVHTKNVITYFQSTAINGRKGHLFVGALNVGMPLIREKNSKYYVSTEIFPNDFYEPYCGGGGILMSGFTASSIHKASQFIPLIPIDDAYLGMCLQRAGLKPENHQGVHTFGIRLPKKVDFFDPCYYQNSLIVHRFVPYEMLVLWKALQVAKLSCVQHTKLMVNISNFFVW